MEMATQVKRIDKISPTRVRLTVEIGSDHIKEQELKAARKVSQVVKIPGFRPGKAPFDLIRQRFKDEIQKEILNYCLQFGLTNAFESTKLSPLNQPILDIKKGPVEGSPFEFEAEFEIVPEFTLAKYTGIPLKLIEITVKNDEIEKSLTQLRNRFATLEPLESIHPKKGDFVVAKIGYELISGEKRGTPNVFTLEVGAGSLLPELDDALLQMVANETKTIRAFYPEQYADRTLAGKEVIFNCTLLEIKEKKIPEPNDSLSCQIRAGLTFEGLRNEIRSEILRAKEMEKRKAQETEIIEYLVSKNSFEIPSSLIEEKSHALLRSIEEDFKQRQLPPPALKAEDEAALRKRAEHMVRGSLILRQIAVSEGINVDENRVEDRVKAFAKGMNQKVEDTVKLLTSSRTMERLRDEVLTEQVFDFLIQNSTMKSSLYLGGP